MANWYYYDDDGNRITVTGKELKELAKNGLIVPDTIVETEEGKSAPARRVKGLKFAETLSIEEKEEIVPAHSPVEANPVTETIPTNPRPFTVENVKQNVAVVAEILRKKMDIAKPIIIEQSTILLEKVKKQPLIAVGTISAFLLMFLVGGAWWMATGKQGHELQGSRATVTHSEREQDHLLVADFGSKKFVLKTVLKGHTGWVLSVAFSPDGKRIVTGNTDNTARIWDAESGRPLRTLEHTKLVRSVAFSPDGKNILTAGDDIVRIWDAESGRMLRTLDTGRFSVYSAALSPDGRRVATSTYDMTAHIWDAESGKMLQTLSGGMDGNTLRSVMSSIHSLSFSRDGKRIVTTGTYIPSGNIAQIWDAESGRLLLTLQGHEGAVNSATFSPDGRHVVTASGYGSHGNRDFTIRIWDADSGRTLQTLEGHTGSVNSAVFSPSGRIIVSGSADHTARIWDAESGRLLQTLEGKMADVFSVAFSPDGRRIVISDGAFDTASIWIFQ